ncbi:MAG: hypothetical protein ACRDT2_02010 [Natronosporangium sp.]
MAAPATVDLGDVYSLSITTRNAAGQPENAGGVTLVITRPDGTPATGTTPSNPSAGSYVYDYLTEHAGRHIYRWLATGANAAAHTDAFNVIPAGWTAIVGLAETKQHLGIPATDTTADETLRGFVLSSSAVVESIVGPVARRTVTETHHGGDVAVVLRQAPVISIMSVTENGVAVAASGYSLSDAGVLYKASNYAVTSTWRSGVNNIAVTYVPGRAIVPPSVLDATKELIRINWRPQQGGNYSDYDQGLDDDYGTREPGEIRLGFFVPHTVMQRLAPETTPDGFA